MSEHTRQMLIGLSGPARSGKDTLAYYLADEYGFNTLALADPIKRGLAAMLGLTDAQLYGDEKEVVDPLIGLSPRQLCQSLGTEWGRAHVRDDLWLLIAGRRIQQCLDAAHCVGMVVTDIRMENEAAWIRSMGGVVVHISREDRPPVHNHVTEAGIAMRHGDFVITNNDTLETFYRKADGLIADIDCGMEFVSGGKQ